MFPFLARVATSTKNAHVTISSYKNNYHMECIRAANARHNVIIFCKSDPLNWQFKTITTKQEITMTTRPP